MINTKALKTLSLIFAIISLAGLIFTLVFAVTLPHSTTYKTIYGTIRASHTGSFDMNYLTPAILFFMGTYIGFSLFGCIKVEGKKEECRRKESVKAECKEPEVLEVPLKEEVKSEEKEESGV